jgi:hypothetical protein
LARDKRKSGEKDQLRKRSVVVAPTKDVSDAPSAASPSSDWWKSKAWVRVQAAIAILPDELESKKYEPKHRARMRTANGHDLGVHDFSADPNLDHFTVARFSGLVLCLGKLEFRAAGLSRFDVPDVSTRHLFNPLNDMHANGRG